MQNRDAAEHLQMKINFLILLHKKTKVKLILTPPVLILREMGTAGGVGCAELSSKLLNLVLIKQ
jgi:hypothetical protein